MQYGHGNGRRGVLTLGRGKQKHVGAGSARSLASGAGDTIPGTAGGSGGTAREADARSTGWVSPRSQKASQCLTVEVRVKKDAKYRQKPGDK